MGRNRHEPSLNDQRQKSRVLLNPSGIYPTRLQHQLAAGVRIRGKTNIERWSLSTFVFLHRQRKESIMDQPDHFLT